MYPCRSIQANQQLRVGGRFVRKDEVEEEEMKNHLQNQVYGNDRVNYHSEVLGHGIENSVKDGGGEIEWVDQMQEWPGFINLDAFF